MEKRDPHLAEERGDAPEHAGIVGPDVAQRDGDAGQRLLVEGPVDVGHDLVDEARHMGLRLHLGVAHRNEHERLGNPLLVAVKREILPLRARSAAGQPAEEVGNACLVELDAAVLRIAEEDVPGRFVLRQLVDAPAVGGGHGIAVADDDPFGRSAVGIGDAAHHVAARFDLDRDSDLRGFVRRGASDRQRKERHQ